MSDLKQNIDKVLSERAKVSDIVLSRFKEINNLTDKIQVIKQQLAAGKIAECEKLLPDLDEEKAKLEKITSDFQFLKERISRTDAVYVGLAGGSRAGKSTFIQALTGLPSDIIPDAEIGTFAPTTAVHSEIHNSPITEVRITLRTRDEFEHFLGEMLKPLGFEQYSTLESFKAFDFSEVDNLENDKWKKLKRVHESLPYFEELLSYPKPIILKEADFHEGKYYFTYMDKDGDSPQKRFWPAVKEAKIYAPFNGSIADDVPIVLLDLPGFNEATEVTNTTVEKLKTVDFTLFIENTSQAQPHLVEYFWKNFDDIKKGILLKDTFSYYITFLLNRWENEEGVDKVCSGLTNQLKERTSHTVSALALKPKGQLNRDGVKAFFTIQAETLGETLPKMDGELFDIYKKTLDNSNIKTLLEKILKVVQNNTGEFASHTRFDDLRDELCSNLKVSLMDLYEPSDSSYSCDNADNIDSKALTMEVKSIEKIVDDHIHGDFWFVPQKNFPDWKSWAESANRGKDGKILSDECHRLWVSIINDYETLDESIFTKKLNELKSDIVNIFKKFTGNLVTKDGTEAIDEIITTLENEGFTDKEPLLDAFKYLQGLKIDFRQNVYPYFFKDGINEVLHYKLGKITGNGIDDYREQLEMLASETNNKIAKAILEHDFLDYFAYCSVMTFTERLVLSNEKSHDYKNLCTRFCDKIYPNEFGANSNRMILRNLEKTLVNAIELVNNF